MQPEVVRRHARQFDDELAMRRAGSQQEFAAGAYIVAHLQQAGYTTRLDAVPVENLIRSTNVVALPPSGGVPHAVVAVGYDAPQDGAPNGEAVGVFLEVARAFKLLHPQHEVEFVALGAENTQLRGGHLGAEKLAATVVDFEPEPLVIMLPAGGGGEFSITATGDHELLRRAEQLGIPARPLPDARAVEVFGRPLAAMFFSGDPGTAGALLMKFLGAAPS